MKLKKRVRIFIIILLIIGIGIGGYLVYKNNSNNKKSVKENKVVSKIEKYDYNLKENKTKKYKEMFKELKEILEKEKVDEEEYAKKISEMFIYDFYSLDDKTAKTDVGGIDFVYKDILENFLKNAENTYYKYIESNIYGDRDQVLPVVDTITVDSIEKEKYTYGETTDDEAYKVKVNWTYVDDEFSSYQNSAYLVFVHNGIKLELVELE